MLIVGPCVVTTVLPVPLCAAVMRFLLESNPASVLAVTLDGAMRTAENCPVGDKVAIRLDPYTQSKYPKTRERVSMPVVQVLPVLLYVVLASAVPLVEIVACPTVKEVPDATPMLGVTRLGPVVATMLPVPFKVEYWTELLPACTKAKVGADVRGSASKLGEWIRGEVFRRMLPLPVTLAFPTLPEESSTTTDEGVVSVTELIIFVPVELDAQSIVGVVMMGPVEKTG